MASANMKDIKRRIKSVESTMQITKAMELVASSKLRRAKEKAEKAVPFFNVLYETMCEITAENTEFNSIFTSKRERKITLMIVIAGDRGLAGGFNANVLKLAQNRYNELAENGEAVIIPIGKKAVEYFEKRDFKIMNKYENIAEDVTIYDCIDICENVISAFTMGKIDRVELFFTNYVSPLVQEARDMSILPIDDLEHAENVKKQSTNYEPSPEAVFDQLIPQYVAGLLFGAMVDSFASEQAARRIAMENASDNATDMINNLSLIYNRARQTTITQEITEIVSGANAQS